MTPKFNSRQECRDFWRAHVLAWKESNLKLPEYCSREGLNRHSFSRHSSRYHREQKRNAMELVEVTHFSEPPPNATQASPLKLHFRECTLEFDGGVDLQLLGNVLEMLEGRYVAV